MQSAVSTLPGLLSHIVSEYPDRIAIRDCRGSFTYGELYRCVAGVAGALSDRQIKPGQRVVCISKKDNESLICFWGILFAGAIPVLLDNEDGPGSNEAKIREVRPAAVIMDKSGSCPVKEEGLSVFDFSEVLAAPDMAVGIMPDEVVCPETCYILLTSGTTGNPKAVQISHTNVLHYTLSIYAKIGSPAQVNAVHASTFAADLGLTNLLVALVSGGMLRILNKLEATDPAIFRSIIEKDRISLLKITPSHLLSLGAYSDRGFKEPIENIILGGEKLSWETVHTLRSLNVCRNLYNHYGPTEATIGAIAFKIEVSSPHFDRTASVPLGEPLGQGACFVDNPKDQIGELYITGPGVSIGYFENPVENQKKFSRRTIDGKDILCYRTGDICRALGDGNFEFLYRTDRQVKIKGYRIELGEVEIAIASHPGVQNVYVLTSEKAGHLVMEAYIKPNKDRKLTAEMLRTWLGSRLSDYKVPSDFYFYTRAPYNANGKIDLEALRKSFATPQAEEQHVPVDPSWTAQVEYSWKKVLNRNSLDGSDHFFETGGDSLLAIQMIGRLQRCGYKVHISDLNNHPRLKDFLELKPASRTEGDGQKANRSTGNWFTYSQHRFLYHGGFDPESYCQTILLETGDSIRVREMALAFNYVLESHPQLTMVFRKNSGVNGSETAGFPGNGSEAEGFPGIDLGTTIIDKRYSSVLTIQETCSRLLKEISIGEGKLFLAHVFVDPGRKDYIFMACHHLCVDVISWNIILEELFDQYEQILKNMPAPVIVENSINRFFAEIALLKTPLVPASLPLVPAIRLPVQKTFKDVAGETEVYHVALPDEIGQTLQKEEDNMPGLLNALLLSAFSQAIFREFDLPAITIDLEFHGRPQHVTLPDISRSVSWWATTFPITVEKNRTEPPECHSLVNIIKAMANNLNLYPAVFGAAEMERPDIRFNYLGRFPPTFGNGALRMRPAVVNTGSTRSIQAQAEYKLYFTSRMIGQKLIVDVQYQPSCLSKDGVGRIIRWFYSRLMGYLQRGESGGQSGNIVLLESKIPSVGQPLYNLNNATHVVNRKNVLLTGVTGFLGIHLLRECLREGCSRVSCLIRGEDRQHAETRLQQCYQHYFGESLPLEEHRVSVLNGDLLTDNFGLSDTDYERLIGETGLVLHSAADTNLMKDYSKLLYANFTSTRNVIQFARTGRDKEIHYVSTLAVSGYAGSGESRYFAESDFDYGQSFVSDYERSKFESEKLIRWFIENGGKGRTYRVGHIAADSVSGRFQRNIEQNRIYQILKGMLVARQIPADYNERVSFSHVDIVAKGIVNVALENIQTDMPCLHMDNPHYVSFLKLAEMLRQMGYPLEVVDMYTFRKTVEENAFSSRERRDLDLMSGWIQRAVDFPRRVHYIGRDTLDLIARAGLHFPKTGLPWFSQLIKEGISAGYFDSPRKVLRTSV